MKLKGQTLFEVILALGIFSIGAVVLVGLLSKQFIYTSTSNKTLRAIELAEEGMEAVRSIRNHDWFSLRPGTYGLAFENTAWKLVSSPITQDGLTRTVIIKKNDEAAKEITLSVNWNLTPTRTKSITLSTLLTDWSYVGKDGLSGNWSSPKIITPKISFKGGATGIDVHDRIGYVSVATSDSQPDFYIVDLLDPYNPKTISSLPIPENARGTDDVAVYGDYAYLASCDDDFILHIINIADPYNPKFISSLSLPNFDEPGKTVAISYPYVYVGTYEEEKAGEFWVVDVRDPQKPTPITSIEYGNNVQDIIIYDNYAYVATSDTKYGEFSIIDISNPTMPALTGFFDVYRGNAGYGADQINDNSAILVLRGTKESNLITVDTTIPTDLKLLAKRTADNYHKVLVIGEIAFVTSDEDSSELRFYNVSNPANPYQTGSLDLKTDAEGMDFLRNTLYVAVRDYKYPIAIISSQF